MRPGWSGTCGKRSTPASEVIPSTSSLPSQMVSPPRAHLCLEVDHQRLADPPSLAARPHDEGMQLSHLATVLGHPADLAGHVSLFVHGDAADAVGAERGAHL